VNAQAGLAGTVHFPIFGGNCKCSMSRVLGKKWKSPLEKETAECLLRLLWLARKIHFPAPITGKCKCSMPDVLGK